MSLIKKVLNSSLFKSAFVYGISNALNGALPFLLLPFLTHFLNPADYGSLAVFMTLISFYNVFVGLSLNGAVFNKYFFTRDHKDFNFSEYLSNAMSLLLLNNLFFVVVTCILKTTLTSLTQLPFEWILLAAISPLFQYVTLILLSLYQAQQQPKKYALILFAQSIINVSASLMLVALFQLNWIGRAMGIVGSLVAAALLSLYILMKKFKLNIRFNSDHIKDILKFGLPLTPHALGAVLISLADRFIITKVAGSENVGYYQAGIQISMIILFFADAFNKAYAPWLFEALQKKSYELNLKIVKYTYLYFVIILMMSAVLSLIPTSLIAYILGEKYRMSQQYIFWGSLAYAFNGMYLMVCNYIFYSNQTKYLAYITLPIGALNICMSYFLTTQIGVVGACISMAISYFLMFLFTWWRSAKLVQMPWGSLRSQLLKQR